MYTHMYSQCMQHPLIQRPDWTTEMPDTAPGVRIFDAPLLVRARRETLVPSGDPLASLGRHGPNTSRNRHSLCNRTRLSIVMARVSPPRSPRAPGEIPVSKRSTPPRVLRRTRSAGGRALAERTCLSPCVLCEKVVSSRVQMP